MASGDEVVLVLASIHGSEPAGTPLLERLFEHLTAHPELLNGRTLIAVPVVNPDGYAKRRRLNSNGVDLNRNFPAKNREERRRHGAKGLSEPESRALAELLDRHQPARIVSIHQPVACVDWDGPARAVAAAMADACPLPLRRLGSMPGSLGSYAGVDLGIPIVTFELRRGDQRPSFGAGGRSNTLFLCLSPCRPIRWLCVRWGGTL
ncbi:MAG: protein MpaA [Planctomycetota bacterium]|jgi:protein MpaA